jgi:hypothetical protein
MFVGDDRGVFTIKVSPTGLINILIFASIGILTKPLLTLNEIYPSSVY